MSTLEDAVEEMLQPSSIEVGGVKITQIRDKKGRVWAVPADDNNADPLEMGFRNILAIPDPEPDFYYQYIGSDRLNEFLAADFALVEPEEVGIPAHSTGVSDLANAQIGIAPTSHHQVGNLHLVKIPKVLEKRYRRQMKARADFAKADIAVPRHLGKPTKQIQDTDVEVHHRQTDVHRGPAVVQSAADFKEYPKEDE